MFDSQQPKVRIGIVGGEGYGKTVFLASLLDLAWSKSGCVQLKNKSQRVDDKIREIREKMRRGERPRTTDGLCDYQYVLGAKGTPQWFLMFRDYPGELIDPAKSKLSGTITSATDDADEDRDTSKSERGRGSRIAKKTLKNICRGIEGLFRKCIPLSSRDASTRKLWKWMRGCDVLIFLLPVNMVSHRHLLEGCQPVDDGKHRIQKLGDRIQNRLDVDSVACLALNRSDLLKEDIECEQLLRDVSEFEQFYGQLRQAFGTETTRRKISSFGKHSQKDMFKPDPDATGAVGVDAMLSEIVPLSEKKRVLKVLDGHERMMSSCWRRHVCSSYYAFKSFRNIMKGIAEPELRNANRKVFCLSFKTLVVDILVAFALASAFSVSIAASRGHSEVSSLNEKIPIHFSSAFEIEALESKIRSEEHCSLWNWNGVLLCHFRNKLIRKFEDRKRAYNTSLLKMLVAEHAKYKSEISDWEKVSADRRSNDIAQVIGVAMNTLSSLTADAVDQRQSASEVLRQLEDFREETKWNYDLDMAYCDWNKNLDDVDRANKAADFLQLFTEGKYPKRRMLIDRVRVEKKRIENSRFGQLSKNLHQERYADDYGEKTDGWRARVERSNERIKMIKEEHPRIPVSSHNEELSKLLKDEEQRLAYLQLYGKFDEDLGELHTHKGDDAYAEWVSRFLGGHPLTKYPNRKDEIDKLAEFLGTSEMSWVSNCLRSIAATNLADNLELMWRTRIERAEARIVLVSNCVARLSPGSRFKEELAETNRLNAAIIADIRRMGNYYEMFDDVNRKEPEFQIEAIDEFMTRFGNGYPDIPPRYSPAVLQGRKKSLIDDFKLQLGEALTQYADKTNLSWNVRRGNAKRRIAENRRYMKGCGIDRKGMIDRDEEFVKTCDANISFDKELLIVRKQHARAKDLFAAIHKFYEMFPETQWRESRKNDYEGVQELERTTVERLKKKLEDDLKENQGATELRQSLAESEARIRLLRACLENYLPSMDEYKQVQVALEQEAKRLLALQNLRVKELKIEALLKENEQLNRADKGQVVSYLYGIAKVIGIIGDSCDDMIKSKYDKLCEIRNELDSNLEKKMRAEIEPHRNKLNGYGLSDDERLQEEKIIADIYQAYLGRFCPIGMMFERANREYESVLKDKKKREDIDVIKRKLVDLKASLDEVSISAVEKKQFIVGFWRDLDSLGKRDEFVSLREEFAALDKQQDDFDFVSRFDEEKVEVNKFLREKPDKNATPESVQAFFHKGQSLSADIEKKWLQDARTRDLALSLKKELDSSIVSVENRVKMDEAFNKFKNAANEFKRALDDNTYDIFSKACDSYSNFARTNGLEKNPEFRKTVNQCVGLNHERKKLEELFNDFCREKTKNRIVDLMDFVKNMDGQLSKGLSGHPVCRFACVCLRWDKMNHLEEYPLQVHLRGYDFKGRFYRKKGVDFWVEMQIGGKTAFKIIQNGIRRNSISSADEVFADDRQIIHDKILVKSLDRCIDVRFANTAFWSNEESKRISRSFVEILADASVNQGKTDVVFRDRDTGSSVTFGFLNLPHVR